MVSYWVPRMTVGWMGQRPVFLESNPRALCESWSVPAFPLATGWECGAGKAGFLSPRALQDQARRGISGRTGLPLTALLTALAMTLIPIFTVPDGFHPRRLPSP